MELYNNNFPKIKQNVMQLNNKNKISEHTKQFPRTKFYIRTRKYLTPRFNECRVIINFIKYENKI